MIGTVITCEHDFIVIVSDSGQVYRTVENDDSIDIDSIVEFDVVDNRAINVQQIFFAPDLDALKNTINNIQVISEDDEYLNDPEFEGAVQYEEFGIILTKLTKNNNTMDVIMPIMNQLGVNMCVIEAEPLKLKAVNGNTPIDVYDHSFKVGIKYTLTRVKDREEQKKAIYEYKLFSIELHNKYLEFCLETIDIIRIQQKLYFGSHLRRKYNHFRFSSAKYNNTKI
jgi:hypothetical protein